MNERNRVLREGNRQRTMEIWKLEAAERKIETERRLKKFPFLRYILGFDRQTADYISKNLYGFRWVSDGKYEKELYNHQPRHLQLGLHCDVEALFKWYKEGYSGGLQDFDSSWRVELKDFEETLSNYVESNKKKIHELLPLPPSKQAGASRSSSSSSGSRG